MQRSVLRIVLCAVLASPLAASGAEPAPKVRLASLDGSPLSLESLKGRVVVLDFWASWCVPCRTSFPFLDSLQTRYGGQGLSVLGLTLEESKDAVIAFLEAVPVRFTIAWDPSGYAGDAFRVVAMPTTFLLDREGHVVARFEGGDRKTHEKLEAAITKLLAGEALQPGADVRVAGSLEATGSLRAWQRAYLADPIMNLDGDPITRMLRDHVHASKEAAAGDGGASGGGCGCN